MRSLLAIVLLIACLGYQVYAIEVLSIDESDDTIAVSNSEPKKLKKGDDICVVYETKMLCGTVVRADFKLAHVKLSDDSKVERVKILSGPQARAHMAPPRETYDFSAGVQTGFSFFMPTLDFQYFLKDHWAGGLKAMLLTSSDGPMSMSADGILISANYYFESGFRGLFFQGATGAMFSTVTSPSAHDAFTSLVLQGSVGYRLQPIRHLNLAGSLGLQVITSGSSSIATFNYTGFRPVFAFLAGYSF